MAFFVHDKRPYKEDDKTSWQKVLDNGNISVVSLG